MEKKEQSTTVSVSSTDEVKPSLDSTWFDEADAYVGERLVRRGRPPIANPKLPVSLRLDPDVVAWFKRGGPGWQSRVNKALRTAAGL